MAGATVVGNVVKVPGLTSCPASDGGTGTQTRSVFVPCGAVTITRKSMSYVTGFARTAVYGWAGSGTGSAARAAATHAMPSRRVRVTPGLRERVPVRPGADIFPIV